KNNLKGVGLWDVNSNNLFRITWKNNVSSGGYGGVNFLELPSTLTGVKARIFGLVGKFFPTGAHKVGATYGCLAPRLVTGTFDPVSQKAVWPSTGNYCRGGAYNAKLLGCESVAILPEEMSRERFEWLKKIGSEVIATPGCESNVKEIYDKCWEIKKERGDKVVVFNQFDEFGNGMWHYSVTASAIEEVLKSAMGPKDNFAGYISATGSAGTIAAGDRLKELYPHSKIVASEALQCPTLYNNGYGGHRIEGIGDKHVPWIHNVKNTDLITAIDDEACMHVMRLFNEAAGLAYLKEKGVSGAVLENLNLLGISGISNMLSAVKIAKYYELTENDILFTIFTDSMEMYQSRLKEEQDRLGAYNHELAAVDFNRYLAGQDANYVLEMTYQDKKRVHNLKYFTWIEQQAKEIPELNAQWYERDYWTSRFRMADEYDRLIKEFNAEVGLL
ncbi:MAG: pyridoxal-phosphate dependent enzyme, partial [Deltaproteobacteria bacterium]|nr:pyridoxal-phosphate dependent enzyme [Deltaproteobacteria bacterium]